MTPKSAPLASPVGQPATKLVGPKETQPPTQAQSGAHPLASKGTTPMTARLGWIIGLGITASLLLVGAMAMLQYLPTKAQAIQRLRSESLSAEISDQDQQILLQALEDTQTLRARLKKAFPTESELLDFIRIIDQIRDTSVQVERFTVDSDIPTKIGKNPSFLPMTLVVAGTSQEISQAVQTIIASPYFIHPVAFTQEFDPTTQKVKLQWQFHLFVADDFVSANP